MYVCVCVLNSKIKAETCRLNKGERSGTGDRRLTTVRLGINVHTNAVCTISDLQAGIGDTTITVSEMIVICTINGRSISRACARRKDQCGVDCWWLNEEVDLLANAENGT